MSYAAQRYPVQHRPRQQASQQAVRRSVIREEQSRDDWQTGMFFAPNVQRTAAATYAKHTG